MKTQPKPSGKPQAISTSAWYYESRGSIHVYSAANPTTAADRNFRIPFSQIIKTLKRCKPELFK